MLSKHLRESLYAETAGICIYCGQEPPKEKLTLDHIVPKKGHGGKNRENLVCACAECNNEKGALTAREHRAMMSPKQRKAYDNRVNNLHHAGFISTVKYELLMGRSIRESYIKQIHFTTLLFDFHIDLMVRRRS